MTGNRQFDALANVPGVQRVEWQKPKQAQGNASRNHYMQQHVIVFSKLRGSDIAPRHLEFEVTRHRRPQAQGAPYTETVMFKDPPQYLHAEAWRILREVTKGKQLLPDHVQTYMEQSIQRRRESEERGPLSASPAEGSLAVVCPPVPGITTAPISPPPGLSQVDHMADGVAAPTSPGAATPSLKNEPSELADAGEPVSERLAKDAETQAFKMRELEHSRFREVVQHPVDVDTKAVIPAMLYAARAELPNFQGGDRAGVTAMASQPWRQQGKAVIRRCAQAFFVGHKAGESGA